MSATSPNMSQADLKGSSQPGCQFNHHLEGLKSEFEVMVEEIKSLRKERDEYKTRVEDLQARCTFLCDRCQKPTTLSSSGPVTRPKLLASDLPQDILPSQQTTYPVITHTHSAKSVSTTSQSSDIVIAHSRPLTSPSSLSQSSVSDADLASGAIEEDWPSVSSSDFGKELHLEIAHVLSHGERIWCIKFSQNGRYLAAGCRDGKACIYDVQTGTLTCFLRNLLAEHDSIRAVSFSRNGEYLATSSSDAYIYVWEIKTKYVRKAFKGHTDLICSLDFSPNDRLLLSASYDNTVRLWNLHSGAMNVLTDDDYDFLNYDYYKSAKFSPDGKCIAASHYDGTVRIWDVRLGRLMRRVRAHTDLVNDIAFMPDGKGLVSGGRDMTLKYWDISALGAFNARPPMTNDLDPQVEEQYWPERRFSGHEDSVYSIAISADGKWVASGSDDQSIRIWDTHCGVVECILDTSPNDDNCDVNSVDFDPSGCYLASGGEDGTVRIWRYSLEVPRFQERR